MPTKYLLFFTRRCRNLTNYEIRQNTTTDPKVINEFTLVPQGNAVERTAEIQAAAAFGNCVESIR